MGRAVDFKCLRLVLPANVVPAARTRAQSVRVPERHRHMCECLNGTLECRNGTLPSGAGRPNGKFSAHKIFSSWLLHRQVQAVSEMPEFAGRHQSAGRQNQAPLILRTCADAVRALAQIVREFWLPERHLWATLISIVGRVSSARVRSRCLCCWPQ